MYKMVGSLPEKDMAMLEERVKRVSKTRPPPCGANNEQPAPTAQPQYQMQQEQAHNGMQPNEIRGPRVGQANPVELIYIVLITVD